ncbi:MAG: DUF6505 family protein [Pseudomonadota bacterium]|nr:DUF6505 family protein [Pseudomonadota bacterium]
MKLARTIRFDPSDLNVFPKAAEEGEWALVGTFCFADVTPDALNGKLCQAFSNGFLGVESFGFSTLVSVVSVRDGEADRLAEQVASAFVERLGAPDLEVARAAAIDEIGFMAELCAQHKTGTLLTIQRELGDNGISERFRSLSKPESCAEQKIWTMVEED